MNSSPDVPGMSEKSVEDEIRDRVMQYQTAYNAGDAEAVAAIYAADGTHTYAIGITHSGRLEIANGLNEMLAGPLKATRIRISPVHIRALSADVAIEEATFSLTGLKGPIGEDLPAVTGICIGVYQKKDHQWFAAAVQCMVPPPTPNAPT